MPAQYKIFPERRLVFSKGSGVFVPADYVGHMAQLLAESEFQPEFDHLVDCRPIESMALNGEQVRDIGSRSAFNSTSKRAFVVSTDIQYGLSRMLATYRQTQDKQEVRVFREMPEALAWLGLPADFEPSLDEAPPAAPSR